MQVVAFSLCKLWHFHYASCGIFIVQVEDFSITNTKKLLSYLSFILGGTDCLGRLAENIKSHRFTQIFSFCFILSRRFGFPFGRRFSIRRLRRFFRPIRSDYADFCRLRRFIRGYGRSPTDYTDLHRFYLLAIL